MSTTAPQSTNQKFSLLRRPDLLVIIGAALLLGGIGIGALLFTRVVTQPVNLPLIGEPANTNTAMSAVPQVEPASGQGTLAGVKQRALVLEVRADGVGVVLPDLRSPSGEQYTALLKVGASTQLKASVQKTSGEIADELKTKGITTATSPDGQPMPAPSVDDPYKLIDIKLSELKKDDLVEFVTKQTVTNHATVEVDSVTWVAAMVGEQNGIPVITTQFRGEVTPSPKPGGPLPATNSKPAQGGSLGPAPETPPPAAPPVNVPSPLGQ